MEEYVQLFVPKELAEKFHLDTLQQQKESYLDKNLQQYYSDVVYTVGYGKSRVTVALLLEHKSYVPRHPWLQLLQYMVNAYTAQAAQTKQTKLKRLTPVIPIIVYHGTQKWKIRTVASYFKGMDAQLTPFVPEFKYLLNDLSHYSEEELLDMDGSWAKRAFLALKASRNRDAVEGLQFVFMGLSEEEVHHILSDFIDLIVVYLLQADNKEEKIMRALNKIESPAKEKVMSAYDQILNRGRKEGIEKGRAEGMEKGREEGIEKGFMKAAFSTFKKGVSMGLAVDDLITLTGVSRETARAWQALLKENPDAELPGA